MLKQSIVILFLTMMPLIAVPKEQNNAIPELLPKEIFHLNSIVAEPLHPKRGLQHVEALTAAPVKCGVLNSKALIITFRHGMSTVKVALDSSIKNGLIDTVRFNFDNKLLFDKNYSIKLKKIPPKSYSHYTWFIIPKTHFQITRNHQQIEVVISGKIQLQLPGKDGVGLSEMHRPILSASLYYVAYTKTCCKINNKIRSVYLIDNTQNLSFTDANNLTIRKNNIFVPKSVEDSIDLTPRGDIICVSDENGKFSTNSSWCYVGHPIKISEKWYKLKINKLGTRLYARKSRLHFGTLQAKQKNWSAQLVSKDKIICIKGGDKPIQLPIGKYAIFSFQLLDEKNNLLLSIKDSHSTPATAQYIGSSNTKKFPVSPSSVIKIKGGETTNYNFGEPYKFISNGRTNIWNGVSFCICSNNMQRVYDLNKSLFPIIVDVVITCNNKIVEKAVFKLESELLHYDLVLDEIVSKNQIEEIEITTSAQNKHLKFATTVQKFNIYVQGFNHARLIRLKRGKKR